MIRILAIILILAATAPAQAGFKMYGPGGQHMTSSETDEERAARREREAAMEQQFLDSLNQKPKPVSAEPEDNFDLSGIEWRRMRGSYSGRGEDITRKFGYRAGTYRLEYVYKAKGHFAIWMYTRRGMSELLVNRVGKADTQTTVALPKDDEVWFEIHSSTGNWEFTFEKIR